MLQLYKLFSNFTFILWKIIFREGGGGEYF